MATEYKINDGRDFDDIFELRTLTSPIPDTGYVMSNGNDVANRFERVSQGSAFGTTGYQRADGTDLGQLFAEEGSVVTWDGDLSDIPSFMQSSNSTNTYTLIELIMKQNGQINQRTESSEINLGRWDGSVARANNTQLYFELLGNNTPNSVYVNGAPSWYRPTSGDVSVQLNSNSTQGFPNDINVRVHLRELNNSSTEITTDVNLQVTVGTPSGGL
tara:strand:+ start:22522 stop:23169 length:648 start_codon:yes stop_codon:yes gene_type:complete